MFKLNQPLNFWNVAPPIFGVLMCFVLIITADGFGHFFFVSMFGEGEKAAPSFFTVLLALGTFTGVVAAAYFYRNQAIAQQHQASIQNLALEVKRFDVAVTNLSTSDSPSVWSYSISEIFTICKQNTDEFHVKTVNFFTHIIDDFSRQLLSGQPDKVSAREHNLMVETLSYMLVSYAGILSKHDVLVGGQYRFYLGVISRLYLPLKKHSRTENYDFTLDLSPAIYSKFSFSQCNLEGVVFKDCLFEDVSFTSCRHVNFKGCLINLRKFNNCSEFNFSKCFIWEEHIDTSNIDQKILDDNFIVLDNMHFEEWKSLPKLERLVDWSKYAKSPQPDFG